MIKKYFFSKNMIVFMSLIRDYFQILRKSFKGDKGKGSFFKKSKRKLYKWPMAV